MSRQEAMIQIRTQAGAAATRPFGRAGWRPAGRAFPAFNLQFDWRRTLHLERRLLSGDLTVIGEVSRRESDHAPTLAALLLGVLAAGLGAWLWMLIDSGSIAGPALRVLLLGSVASIAAWGLWLVVTRHALGSILRDQRPAANADAPDGAGRRVRGLANSSCWPGRPVSRSGWL